MLNLDGSQGEGGGQVLRTSLACSLVTGQPFRITNIRAGRRKPGLLRQHLTGVRAAKAVGDARVKGDELGSHELEFRPGKLRGGDFHFSIGTAGSTTLVFQTILPALLKAPDPTRVVLEGGTHNPLAPPFEFIERCFVPLLERMGAHVAVRLDRPGFAPAGGGMLTVDVAPAELSGFELLERGAIQERRGTVVLAHLSEKIAEREIVEVSKRVGWPRDFFSIRHLPEARGPGNALLLEVVSEHVTELFASFGRVRASSESVADEACDELLAYLAADVPVGPHLADQLLLPLALAGRGSFRTVRPTLHARTQVELLRTFLGVAIREEREEGKAWRFTVG